MQRVLAISAVAMILAVSAPEAGRGAARTESWIVPGTGLEIVPGQATVDPDTGLPQAVLLEGIGAWVSLTLGLPRVADLPHVALVPSQRMVAIRLERSGSVRPPSEMGGAGDGVVAIYDNVTSTIYLPEGWTGSTPAELSVLVHEMVHHIQNRARLSYPCPEALEKPAFAAQQRWLAQFDTDLAAEFGIDPMTLLVRTSCMY